MQDQNDPNITLHSQAACLAIKSLASRGLIPVLIYNINHIINNIITVIIITKLLEEIKFWGLKIVLSKG